MKPRQQSPRVGIRDVAQRAGVSIGSASRVINGVANVAPALRERVREAVGELGYRPNHAARSLRMQATRTIGCLLSNVTDPLHARLFQAIEERLRRAGYVVLLANSLGSAEREVEILGTFALRGVDGLIVGPGGDCEPAVLQALHELALPLVVLDRDIAPEQAALQHDEVQHHHEAGLHAVAAHLAGLGHRHVALVVQGARRGVLAGRIEGFRRGLQAAGLQSGDTLIVELPEAGGAYRAVMLLLEREQRPTALAVEGLGPLLGALYAVAAKGLRIPHDVSLVSIGDPPFGASHTPPLTVLDVNTEATAEQVVALLLERVQGREHGAGRVVQLPPVLIERHSCMRPAGAPPAADVSRLRGLG